ncbi:MAG: patatin-like phospholipase family protein, partial [Polyangiales bacterium]
FRVVSRTVAMSTIDPTKKLGLCLFGGGITGAMYEVGVLAALEDSFDDFRAADFDVFVGASSGAVVAAALAGGLTAQRMYRALLDPADDFFPLQRNHLLRFDGREILRVSTSTVGALRKMIGSVASKPLEIDLWNEIDRFYDSLPAGFFSTEPFEKFLSDVFRRRSIPETFDEFEKNLIIIASDLDRGEPVFFSKNGTLMAPVTKAVAASCAAPMLYAPVRIDDRDLIGANSSESDHVSIAVEHGCQTVLLINPLVPIRTDTAIKDVPTGHGQKRRIRDKGLLWVYNQNWRVVSNARLRRGLRTYRAEHPEINISLIEPESDDATMFLHSPMNFAARREILEHAYKTTVQRLQNPQSTLRASLIEAGLHPNDSLIGTN